MSDPRSSDIISPRDKDAVRSSDSVGHPVATSFYRSSVDLHVAGGIPDLNRLFLSALRDNPLHRGAVKRLHVKFCFALVRRKRMAGLTM